MRVPAIAAMAALTLVGAAHAADDPMLQRLGGDWVGNGQFRWDSVTDPERLFCHITASFMPDGSLQQTGRCALPTDSAALTIEIHPNGSGGYSGTAKAGPRQPVPFSGTGKQNQFVLIGKDSDGNPSTTTIDLLAGGFHVIVDHIDPKTGKKYAVGDVTFLPE